MEITVKQVPEAQRKPHIPDDQLVFGRQFTDHMFVMEYDAGKGWHSARIEPYGPFSLEPSALVLHYAQEIFEGMKAFRREDGRIAIFRPKDNFARFNHSAERLCMPQMDEAFMLDALKQLVRLDQSWVPQTLGTSLYIRPTMIATEAVLGVRPSSSYLCYILLSPVGAYYKAGLKPVNIWITDKYVRAAPGGTGDTKAGANYAISLYGGEEAHKYGCEQVLWLDAVHRRYVEEVGSMNMMFVYDGKVVTSPLHGTILNGVTRRSILTLVKDMGIEVEERALSVDEIMEGAASGRLSEAFGTGTACVVSPVGKLTFNETAIPIGKGGMGELTAKLYDTLTGIQYGRLEDKFGWIVKL